MLKMYVVVRANLGPGQQAVQGMHALADFANEHPAEFKAWQQGNNTLVFLQAKDEGELLRLKEQADDGGMKYTLFREPDLLPSSIFLESGTVTAIAFAPDWAVQYIMLADLPLALPNVTTFELETKRRWFGG